MVNPVPGSLYVYAPVKGVSIVFAVLFLISGLLHLWQNNIKHKTWRIGGLFPWAAAVFVGGYALREYNAYHYDQLDTFIASTVMLFVAPPVYNGANYFIFGRALFYLPYLSSIHPGRVWSTFVFFDLIDGAIAGTGASYTANQSLTEAQHNIGIILVKTSLFLLIGLFVCFVLLVVQFHRRCLAAGAFNHRMKVVIYTLYVSSFLILLRNCFRTAAFFFPYDSPANGEEALYWVFEGLPMFVNSVMFNIWPPAEYLAHNHKTYLAKDGKTELEGPGMVDNRAFIWTVIDPFDIKGIITGADNRNRYWEHDGIGGPKSGSMATTLDGAENGGVKTHS